MRRRGLRFDEPRVAVVTGAASGIGQGIAKALAADGWHLALLDVNQTHLTEVAARLESCGLRVTQHVVDVSLPTPLADVREAVVEAHGGVSLLVNSAGVSLAGSCNDTPLSDLEWVMRINFGGTANCCKVFLPDLLVRQRAHIVNVSSSFGLIGFPDKSGYAASKFAVRGFSESLRMELANTGVGVTVLYPGPVDTRIVREGRARSEAQREREASFLSRRAIPVEQVAAATLRGIERDAARVLLSRDYRLIDWLTRLSPSLALTLIGKLGARELG